MRRWIFALFFVLPGCTQGPALSTVTVFAASSLTELLTDIAADWTRSGKAVKVQFGASSMLARQIQEGAKADLLISASPEWLEQLHPIERYDWLSNRLVVVVPKDSPQTSWNQIESLALANEQVPVGKYGRAALSANRMTPPTRTIYGSSVRDVVRSVVQGGAAAGIIYATDAAVEPKLRVIHVFPSGTHPRIVYSVGLLRPEGRAFFLRLRDAESFQHAVDRGFLEIR